MAGEKRRYLQVGDTVLDGKYEVIKIIHTSGMANVYMVEDENLNKQWCLKEIIKSEAGRNEIEYRSLIKEANIMKSLSHSSIPRIVSIDTEGDSIFIVMDFVDGISVKDWLVRRGSVEQTVAVAWMKQVCNVLLYLHTRKNPIFYRDMKPDNIMVQSDGNIKLLDFGISEIITKDNMVIKEALGTRGFAAPEQKVKGSPYDLRSDIFGVGRTMYYMLTGLNPSVIGEKNLRGIREVNPSVSIGLERVVNKCMEEDVNKRYQSIEEVLYDIQNYNKLDYSYRKKIRRKVDTVLFLLVGSVFMACMSVVPFMIQKSRASDEYNTLVEVAMQSGRVEDFKRAIEKNPVGVKPYLGYIDEIKSDGVFDKNEEKDILNYINPVLSDVKKERDYPELAYEMGKLYWFYYDSDVDTNMTLSVKWFEDAKNDGYNVDESTIMYDLGQFKKNISMSIAESSDSGMYKEYWDELMKAKSYNSGEIVELQINTAIINAISSNAYRLRKDGVSLDELKSEVERIGDYLKETSPSEGKATKLYETLESKYKMVSEDMDDLYRKYQGGEE